VDGKLVLIYELLHVSGQSREGVYPLPERGTPQEIGGAITYARRYCLCAVTGVAPDDDDNDAALAERAATRRARREDRSQPNDGGKDAIAKDLGIAAVQQRQMQDLFRAAGIVERDDKLKYAIDVVGHALNSAAGMTRDEADQVIGKLKRYVEQQQPPAGDES
jgi:hypothetical protein